MNKSENTATFTSWALTILKVALMAIGIFLFFVFIAGRSTVNAKLMVNPVDLSDTNQR